jgi:hypothetical protein
VVHVGIVPVFSVINLIPMASLHEIFQISGPGRFTHQLGRWDAAAAQLTLLLMTSCLMDCWTRKTTARPIRQ